MSRAKGLGTVRALFRKACAIYCVSAVRTCTISIPLHVPVTIQFPALRILCSHRVVQSSPLLPFAAFGLSTSAKQEQAPKEPGDDRSTASKSDGTDTRQKQGITRVDEEENYRALTDKIPQRPVGVVEGTSYTVIILAGIAFAAAVLWAAVNELLLEPKEYKCFSLALDKVRADPRVTVRLGTPISGYGSESRNRAARQRVPHRYYVDDHGVEHIQVQFYARGPSDVGRVSADMYKEEGKKDWKFLFLYVDIDGRVPQRIVLLDPSSFP